MCEKRARKIKRGSQLTRLREARRLQRRQWLASPPSNNHQSNFTPALHSTSTQVDKIAQNRLILELALKTIGLMHKNRLIQQKIVELRKETSEFVASVMNNPESKRRYLEQVRLRNIAQAQQAQNAAGLNLAETMPLKVEPKE